tara:strand:- start:639 stop:839 length:201 start_codon:yes stop_codon:yes gene_type:complete
MKKWMHIIGGILIFLGLVVTYGTHIMLLRIPLEESLQFTHAVLNLIASGMITIGSALYVIAIWMRK